MARYNEILVGRYNRFLQKLLQMKGGPPSPQLSSEIGVGFVLFNGNENRYLEGWDLFSESVFQAASVGNNSGIRFRNPAGSNVIAVIMKLAILVGTADTILLLNATADVNLAGGPGGGSNRLDARGRSSSTCATTTGVAVAGGTQIARAAINTNFTYDFILTESQELPVLPGDQIDVRSSGLNEAIGGTIMWRERFLEEAERT
jgi:hypothetical protein